MNNRIAIVLTCHNRWEKTKRCLRSLTVQKADTVYDIRFYVCEDGCTDGTGENIRREFPETVLVTGSGNLFWARGMAMAMERARQDEPDMYLMVNDDVEFLPNAIKTMLDSYDMCKGRNGMVCIAGATLSRETGKCSYGGRTFTRRKIRYDMHMVLPGAQCPACYLANWNCFLLPANVAAKVGGIDRAYEHGMADYDYCARVKQAGGDVFVARDYIGYCENNPEKGSWRDTSLPLSKRWALMRKPTGLPPRSYLRYCRRVFGATWLLEFMIPYANTLRTQCMAWKRTKAGKV